MGCVDWSNRLFYWKNAIYPTSLSHTRESSVGRVPKWPSGPSLCRASRGPCGWWGLALLQAQKQRWADRALRLEFTGSTHLMKPVHTDQTHLGWKERASEKQSLRTQPLRVNRLLQLKSFKNCSTISSN